MADEQRKAAIAEDGFLDRIMHNIAYHSPRDLDAGAAKDVQDRMEQVRQAAAQFASTVYRITSPGREESMSATALEDCVMYAIASLARYPDKRR